MANQVLADRIVFGECHRQNSLPNLLTQEAGTMIKAYDGKKQTPHTAPVVMINDLAKTHGSEVNVTIIHDLSEQPSMGLKKRDGYEEDVSTSDFGLSINQYHHSTKISLMMEQQKVGWNRNAVGRPLLTTYHGKLTNELSVYALCGARGTQTDSGRILPLAGADFDEIMVNPVTAPTFNRMMYCGAASSIDGTTGSAITTSDYFTDEDPRKFKEKLELMEHPIKPVKMGADAKQDGTDPMFIGFITPKQWTTYEENSTDFQKNIANALTRTKGFNHPLFQGEMFMKDGILFKKYNLPVGFAAGEDVDVSLDQDDATTAAQTVPAGVTIERGFILGGQALAMAYGSVLPGGQGNFKVDSEVYNQKAWLRTWMDWIMGLAKIKFADSNGRIEDYGVMCFDSHVG